MKTEPEDYDRYPPISDYGFIADCHASALVSRAGSIDWCCMPRFDSKSCFGRLLDWRTGGYYQIVPVEVYESSRRYLPDTLVLETTFRTASGEARLFDCLAVRPGSPRHPYRQLLRILEGVLGQVDFRIEIVPRFEYGAVKPWIRHFSRRQSEFHVALGGNNGMLVTGSQPLNMRGRHDLEGGTKTEPGRRVSLSVIWVPPEELDEGRVDSAVFDRLDHGLDETVAWWRSWCAQGRTDLPYPGLVRRSAIVLKGLSNVSTGAIAAAPTASLPEAPGGVRNWDYRYSWIRDSTFAVNSLAVLGHAEEAESFRRFIERSAAGSAEELQILFGVGGERHLHEYEIKWLEGYRGARPVRVGNAAEVQLQLDAYGELLELAWRWHMRGKSPDADYREFLFGLVNSAAESWHQPDCGIWEMRGSPRHFVQSKVMCWAALDRGIKLLDEFGWDGPSVEWRRTRAEIRSAIECYGYDSARGTFVQAFDSAEMDAALLLLPTVGFVDFDDERMIRTTDAIRSALSENGLLRRYRAGSDGLKGKEGVFLPCSFWLAECLARQRRLEEAEQVLRRVLATANDLGLFSEEYDVERGEMLGNFPQCLTHLSLITAVVALDEMQQCLSSKPR